MMRRLTLTIARVWHRLAGPKLCATCGTARDCDDCIGGGIWE